MEDKKNLGYRYLLKNIGLLSISQFGTKILVFFLVPLYTSILTTSEYGIYDFISTTVSLLIPLFTMQIMDSVLRFCLNEKYDKREVFSVGFKIVVFASIIVAVLLSVNSIFRFVELIDDYKIFFLLMFLVNSFYSLLSNFARGIENVFAVSVAGIILTSVNIVLNLLFLIFLGLGLDGYFLATIISSLSAVLFLSINIRVWDYVNLQNKNRTLQSQMISYSVPLIFTAVSWWINSVSDRYVVIAMCGIAVNGIYSVGYKIPSILNVFQSIFNQAWVLSSVKDFDSNDSAGFFSRIYNTYSFLMILVCSIVIITTKVLARFLYAKDFYSAWFFVPLLTFSIVFTALAGYLSGIFSANMDSKTASWSTIIGAIVNIVLNIILVYCFGAIGAAIATLVSSFIVWQLRIVLVKKYINLELNYYKQYLCFLLLLFQSILIMFVDENFYMYGLQIFLLGIIIILYKEELGMLVNKIKHFILK